MSFLRLVVAWLVMAALPLQGLAAASMLFCGSQAAALVAQAGEHHAAQDHSPCEDAGSMQSHSCPVCATCSQAQAVGGFGPLPFASPAPLADPAQPPLRMSSRTLTPPDKPPRA